MRSPQVIAALLVIAIAAPAQQAAPKAAKASADAPEHASSLPVTRVSLYKNGVGFFEHTGHVTGNSAVTIDFTSSQLNDVLQSLTAIDLNGGRISGAGYNSMTPLEQQLRNLPISLSENPTAADFYAAVRGARVEVRAGTNSITGRLLAVEVRGTSKEAGSDSSDSKAGIDHYFLTVVSDSGDVKSIELTPTTSVQLLDSTLHTDVTRYLQLLDSNRSQGLRHLTLDDKGTGSRELRVSYISEVPIWKSTYRILFTDSAKAEASQTATLQGWSVVDNTTGTDWLNVQLSLIAGAPQSFIQPLSQPIYSRRPEIPIATEAQLTPQTFDSSIEADSNASADVLSQNQLQTLASNGRNFNAVHGAASPKAVSMGVAGYSGVSAGMAGGSGIGPGSGGNYGGGVMRMAAAPPPSYEDEAKDSISPASKAAAFDDFFAYNLTEPVTIRKNESALVPILQAKIDADRVTLVSSNGNSTTQPLRALWITNNTGLTLDSGSFSIVENGNFGGEGLLDPIHDKEKRLLSYAADQAVHVSTEKQVNNSRVTHITAAKGVLVLHSAVQNEITYVVHNSAADSRTIVLEHPVQRGYELTSDVKPTETTPTVYRFRLAADPGKTVRLRVAASHRGAASYQLTRSDDNQFAYIINESGNDTNLQTALAPILEARRHVADTQTAVDKTKASLEALRADEERQRSNITALATADKASRDRFVHDLNQTEDKITAAQSELTTRTAALDAAKADLANRIQSLQIDEQVNQK